MVNRVVRSFAHALVLVLPLQCRDKQASPSEPPPLDGRDAARSATAAPARARACAPDMVLVDGDYCPVVEQRCLAYLQDGPPYTHFRCERYDEQPVCRSARIRLRFCIDRFEYVAPGETLPMNEASLADAERLCAAAGKRPCLESEWNFACEGERMQPYPYGFERDASACHIDRTDLFEGSGKLADLRAAPGDFPDCASPFGVLDLSGNLEESVTDEATGGVALKGAYWQPGQNHCRARQTAHDRYYAGIETGFRCCANAGGGGPSTNSP